MRSLRWSERLRSWLAGLCFRLAGKLDSAYDVWLDEAQPRAAVAAVRAEDTE